MDFAPPVVVDFAQPGRGREREREERERREEAERDGWRGGRVNSRHTNRHMHTYPHKHPPTHTHLVRVIKQHFVTVDFSLRFLQLIFQSFLCLCSRARGCVSVRVKCSRACVGQSICVSTGGACVSKHASMDLRDCIRCAHACIYS